MVDTATPALTSNTIPEGVDLTALSLSAAAQAIRNGDITAEVYADALLRHARQQEHLRSFISVNEPELLAAARDADKAHAAGTTSPLLGVPIGVKDSFLTSGIPTSLGLQALTGFVPREDAKAVQAIKAAGAIVFGKTNLVELSFGLTGHNAFFGQVKNPVSPDRVSGGSSSGSAASVAAGIVPASLGGDTIGSIRVPASLCGVVGFKPTTTRWPRGGIASASHTLDTPGVLARSVADCALLDTVVSGEPALKGHTRTADLKGSRLAYAPRQVLDFLEPDIESRFRDTLRVLREAGAEIVEVDLGADFGTLSQTATWSIFFHETMDEVSAFLRQHDVPITFDAILDGLKPDLQQAWRYLIVPEGAGAISAETYKQALTVSRPEIERRVASVFAEQGAQAMLQPTTPCAAPLIDQQSKVVIADREVDTLVLANHTVVASLLGLPAISLPMGQSTIGLPLGLEVHGAVGHDRALLSLVERIEGALIG